MRKKAVLHRRGRALRREQTPAEEKLWNRLRGRETGGFKFRRQFPVKGYIADFCCPERKLIIELDGEQHSEQQEYDSARTAALGRWGYKVLRFWNSEVLERPEEVLEAIFNFLNEA